MSGHIYFLLNVESRAVKIGYASNLRTRISTIGVSSPHRLELIASTPGTIEQEQLLHSALCGHRMSGEWFKWDLVTHELIERAKAGAPFQELFDFATGKLFTQTAGTLVSHIEETVG